MRTRCGRTGCDKPGTHGLQIKMWAKGYSKESHDPSTGSLGVAFCHAHAMEEARDKTFMNDAFWDLVQTATASMGRAAVDRDTVEVIVIPILEMPSFEPARRERRH